MSQVNDTLLLGARLAYGQLRRAEAAAEQARQNWESALERLTPVERAIVMEQLGVIEQKQTA